MSWLKFKGIHSDAMGLIVASYPPILRPEQRIETVKIPGRHGELTLQTGPVVYEASVRECECIIAPGVDILALSAWLQGRGDLELGNEAGFIYDARVVAEIPYEKILREREYRELGIPFLCQPLKRKTPAEADIIRTATGTISNPGTVESRPRVKLEGSGNVRLMLGGAITTITGLSGAIILDSELGMALDATGTQNLSHLVDGDWPRLAPGSNGLSWTGTVTRVTVTPRWRWL